MSNSALATSQRCLLLAAALTVCALSPLWAGPPISRRAEEGQPSAQEGEESPRARERRERRERLEAESRLAPTPGGVGRFSALRTVDGELVRPLRPQEQGPGIELSRRLRLDAYVRLGAAFDSNPRRATEDAESDLEGFGVLGASLTYRTRRTLARVSYSILGRSFMAEDDLSSVEQRLRLLAQRRWSRVSLALRGALEETRRPNDPRFLVGDLPRRRAQVSLQSNIRLTKRWGLGLEPSAARDDFLSSEFDAFDHDTVGANAYLSYRLQRISLLAGGGYSQLRYTDDAAQNPDLRFVSGFVGLRVSASRRLSGEARVGYSRGTVIEERDPLLSSEDPSGLIASVSFAYALREQTVLSLRLSRSFDFALQAAAQVSTRAELGIVHALTRALSVRGSIFGEHQEPTSGDDLRNLGASAGLRLWLSRHVSLDAALRGEHTDFGGDTFQVVRLGAALTYQF